jgi:hypothetical protein
MLDAVSAGRGTSSVKPPGIVKLNVSSVEIGACPPTRTCPLGSSNAVLW